MTNDEFLDMIKETYAPNSDHLSHVLFCMVGVAGEAGEIANMCQKGMRGDWNPEKLTFPTTTEEVEQRDKLITEMGGVFYFLHALCWQLGVDPEDVMKRNATKLRDRLKRGMIRGDGDHR